MTKLERSWKNCLRMWKWIAEVYGMNVYIGCSVDRLKSMWMKDNRFTKPIENGCFFCEHTGETIDHMLSSGCDKCPGRLVQKEFSCMNDSYHYDIAPKAFYKKICQLAKKGGYGHLI